VPYPVLEASRSPQSPGPGGNGCSEVRRPIIDPSEAEALENDARYILVGTRELYRMQVNDPDARLAVGTAVDPRRACEETGWGAESARCKAV
jgi:hypothetical protein